MVLKIIIKKISNRKIKLGGVFFVYLFAGKSPTSGEQSKIQAQAQIKHWYVVEQLLDLNLINLRQNSL